MNKRWNPDFRLTFQWLVAQIEYSRPWKVLRKSRCHLLFILPKSSFGEHKFRNHELWLIFGKFVKRQVCQKWGWVADCWFGRDKVDRNSSFFQNLRLGSINFAAQTEYEHPLKRDGYTAHSEAYDRRMQPAVQGTHTRLRKRIRKCWFGLPKSSFGMGKVHLSKIFMLWHCAVCFIP